MAKEKNKRKQEVVEKNSSSEIHPEIKKNIWIIALIGFAIILLLATVGEAGPLGGKLYSAFHKLFGVGYYLLPTVSVLFAFSLIGEEKKLSGLTLIGGAIFILSGLGFLDVALPGRGGLTGRLVGTLDRPFGVPASVVILISALIASFLIIVNRPMNLSRFIKSKSSKEDENESQIIAPLDVVNAEAKEKNKKEEVENSEAKEPEIILQKGIGKMKTDSKAMEVKNYVPPPASLLVSSVEKPTIGDLRANANVIKRTLESFGIPVEMSEINVGPTVTRFTLKPAEGIKLSRLIALHQDLALALAAHPIRIEAPIPGKSLVGIEVPNKSAAVVRLGSLILYPEFQKSSPLTFTLGRNVSGEPVFTDIAKMPHLLIAGATGSGKSISIHALIISLLYKNSPEMLKLILIDPKRVELSMYNGIPHLLAPVITDNKKSIGSLRWAIQEMERRYQLLNEAGSRDIKSFNKKKEDEQLSYILIIIDELADLMASYGREVEGSIIRLAQMARAVGIHLIVSTQRPSVEVITGLIKANITTRVALQVASQIDSRTILDSAGAEKLLGNGDLLFMSSDFSKPRRIQGSYISEEEVKKVIQFIKKNNPISEEEEEVSEEVTKEVVTLAGSLSKNGNEINFDEWNGGGDDDELYEEAVEVVRSAKKASASLLQRRLRVGYARAARLIDMMEEKGIVGRGEGAKPREVLL